MNIQSTICLVKSKQGIADKIAAVYLQGFFYVADANARFRGTRRHGSQGLIEL